MPQFLSADSSNKSIYYLTVRYILHALLAGKTALVKVQGGMEAGILMKEQSCKDCVMERIKRW
ncbi:MAG: hypothetical protein ABS46_16290 [Cytophagaceae bacterium SCN 52-12]|nr:MAG: hypothetical protein ABS46_16290 [Cytophagaceae bacterium SCN 52-12]